MMTSPSPSPSVGAAVLISNGPRGWQPGALLFPKPLLLFKVSSEDARLFRAGDEAPIATFRQHPLDALQEVLAALLKHVPAAGPGAGKPTFPVAVLATTYEFGSRFSPHERAFKATPPDSLELFASIYIDAYRPDSQGGTERIGYAGMIPEGWMEGCPALQTEPWGHDAPPMFAHPFQSRGAERLTPKVNEQGFRRVIETVQGYLAAGDIYQANLTIPLEGRTSKLPEQIFDEALKRGGAAYGGMMLLPSATLLSLSPELLLRRRDDLIETRPIKGTRPIPRHITGIMTAREELSSSEKDKAEHLMIVDLERNDLGRLCKHGTVEVVPFMDIVEHPMVVHMESTVKGKLKGKPSLRQMFEAIYPGGSVTGAPKKRAMEIISELEIEARGIYCGAFGWVDAAGDCEFNLPIRTAVIGTDGLVQYNAGCGIVADSDPKEEWDELETKVAFFRSILEEPTD